MTVPHSSPRGDTVSYVSELYGVVFVAPTRWRGEGTKEVIWQLAKYGLVPHFPGNQADGL